MSQFVQQIEIRTKNFSSEDSTVMNVHAVNAVDFFINHLKPSKQITSVSGGPIDFSSDNADYQ